MSISSIEPVVKDGRAELHTRDFERARGTKNFILSERPEKAHYLCSETATCIGSGKEIERNNTEDKGKQKRTELHIRSIDQAMKWEKR